MGSVVVLNTCLSVVLLSNARKGGWGRKKAARREGGKEGQGEGGKEGGKEGLHFTAKGVSSPLPQAESSFPLGGVLFAAAGPRFKTGSRGGNLAKFVLTLDAEGSTTCQRTGFRLIDVDATVGIPG